MADTYNYFVLAYMAIWGLLFAYQVILHRRFNKIRAALETLNGTHK